MGNVDYLCSLCGLRLPTTGADCRCVRVDTARIEALERALEYALRHHIPCECGGAGKLIHVHRDACPWARVQNIATGIA